MGSALSGEMTKLQNSNLFTFTFVKSQGVLLRKGGTGVKTNRITAITLTVVLRLIKNFPSKQDFCKEKIVHGACDWGKFSRKETFQMFLGTFFLLPDHLALMCPY